MIKFLKVEVFWENGKILFRLLQLIEYDSSTVPIGFVSDGASIPRVFWPILPKTEEYLPEAFDHDHSLKIKKLGWKESNKRMRNFMRENKVSWWKRTLVGIGIEFGRFFDRISFKPKYGG